MRLKNQQTYKNSMKQEFQYFTKLQLFGDQIIFKN